MDEGDGHAALADERDRHLAEHVAGESRADHPLDPVDELDRLDTALQHCEQRALGGLGRKLGLPRARLCFTLHRVVGLVRRGVVGVVVLLVAGCGGGSAPDPPPTHRAATLPAPAERCGSPDTPARPIRFRTGDGVELDGAVVGSGPVGAVLVHEYPGPMCGWWPYANYLSRHGVQALLFDLRCFGLSSCPAAGRGHATTDVAAAMSELRRHGARRIAIVGASMGGAVAVVAAARLRPAAVVDLSGER